MTFLELAEHIGSPPDVIGLGGWNLSGGAGNKPVGSGYHGAEDPMQRATSFLATGAHS
jgi:hypothetical protein